MESKKNAAGLQLQVKNLMTERDDAVVAASAAENALKQKDNIIMKLRKELQLAEDKVSNLEEQPPEQNDAEVLKLAEKVIQLELKVADYSRKEFRSQNDDAKSVYEDGGKWLLSQTPAIKKYAVLDYVLVSLLALPFLAFLLYPVLHPGMAGRDFVFFIGFLCTFGCGRLLVVRNRIPVQNFNLTVCLSLAIQLLLLFYAALPLVWTLFIALVMLAAFPLSTDAGNVRILLRLKKAFDQCLSVPPGNPHWHNHATRLWPHPVSRYGNHRAGNPDCRL